MLIKLLGKLFKVFSHDRTGQSPRIDLSEQELDAHFRKNTFGNFTLSQAIRPHPDCPTIPQTGFRFSEWVGEVNGKVTRTPVIIATVSKEHIFDLLLDLIGLLNDEFVDVVLETRHETQDDTHEDLIFEMIEPIILKSRLCDFEDLLVDDGDAGIAILDNKPLEIQLDDHKTFIIYNWNFVEDQIMEIFERYGLREIPSMKFLHEVEHIHYSSPHFASRFEELARTFSD